MAPTPSALLCDRYATQLFFFAPKPNAFHFFASKFEFLSTFLYFYRFHVAFCYSIINWTFIIRLVNLLFVCLVFACCHRWNKERKKNWSGRLYFRCNSIQLRFNCMHLKSVSSIDRSNRIVLFIWFLFFYHFCHRANRNWLSVVHHVCNICIFFCTKKINRKKCFRFDPHSIMAI